MSETPESPVTPPEPTPPPPSPPPATGPDNSERQFALFVHLSALLGFTAIPFANVLAPLILWQIKKNESAFIDDQGKEAVNFNLCVLIIGLALVLLTMITFGLGIVLTLPIGVVLAIAWLVLTIIGGIKANDGEAYRYPYIFRLIK